MIRTLNDELGQIHAHVHELLSEYSYMQNVTNDLRFVKLLLIQEILKSADSSQLKAAKDILLKK